MNVQFAMARQATARDLALQMITREPDSDHIGEATNLASCQLGWLVPTTTGWSRLGTGRHCLFGDIFANSKHVYQRHCIIGTGVPSGLVHPIVDPNRL